MNRVLASCLLLAVFMLTGCATSRNVVVNPGSRIEASSAYVVAHGGNSGDMDASIQRALMTHGLRVTSGPDGQPTNADLVVRYSDNWK